MSLEVNSSAPDVTGANHEITDEAFNKFFESGGEESPVKDSKDTQTTQVETQEVPKEEAKQEEPKQQEDVNEKISKLDSNYKAMAHQERQLRKEIEEKMRRMEHAFNKFQEKLTPQEAPPSYDENPLEALKYQQKQLEEKQRAHEEFLRRQAEEREIEQSRNQFLNEYANNAKQYMQDNPEFGQAYNYAFQARYNELRAIGYDDQTAQNIIYQDEAQIVAKAFTDGVNPGEYIYKYAQARGFQPPSKQAQNEETGKSLEDAKRKLEAAKKGVEASRSLSDASARPNDGPMTLERLATIEDDAEFSKMFDKMMKNRRD